jgi:streptogramin lyase
LPAGLGDGDVGGGFGWLADDDGVLQLNQLTGSPLKTLPTDNTAAVVYADGKLWVKPTSSSSPATAHVLEVDPHDGTFQTIFLPGSSDAVYRGGGYVWVAGRKHIDQIDPATGRIRPLPFGLAQPHVGCAATYADGALWIANAGPRGQLLKIAPRSLAVEHHTAIPDGGEPEYCVTAGAGKVWVGSARGHNIYAFDPHSARPTGLTIHVGRMHGMTGTRAALWFSTAKAPATLRAVTGDGTPVATVPLPTRPGGFRAFGTLLYAGFTRPT